MEASAQQLSDFVDEVLASTGAEKVDDYISPGPVYEGSHAFLLAASFELFEHVGVRQDVENEAVVRAGLERLTAGRTVLLVTHRLHTVRDADRIVFLDRGRIVEQGIHEELVRRSGRYARFWETSVGVASSIRA
ncbi:hypothetical protein [Rhodococcus pyridinivorans]|uniref:hypothetical protein n=1 Tax=Rhodococcus pyridinivorans TaxID=103816 RepID=UPI003AAA3598